MLSHKIGIFQFTGNVIIMGDYSDEESNAYLEKFLDVSFNFNGDVQSIGFELQVPHKNRLANLYLFDRPANEIIEMNNNGKQIKPMGAFQLKLSQDGKKDIWSLV